MTKRRAETLFIHDNLSPTTISLFRFDTQFESMAAAGDLNPPSMLALLNNKHRKKRPFHFEEGRSHEENSPPRKISTSNKLVTVTSLDCSVQDGRFKKGCDVMPVRESNAYLKKHAREDPASLHCFNKVIDGVLKPVTSIVEHDDGDSDLSKFNSFQYWRAPLPALDLSLLQDLDSTLQPKGQFIKHVLCDAMET